MVMIIITLIVIIKTVQDNDIEILGITIPFYLNANRLDGQVVKASASRAEDPVFESYQ